MNPFANIAGLAVAAVAPAAIALFLLRKPLGGSPRQELAAIVIGALGLSGLAGLETWVAAMATEDDIARCEAAAQSHQAGCDDLRMMALLAGAPAAASVLVFLIGAAVWRVVRSARRDG